MLRKIVTTSLVAFSLPIVGCSLMYDFEKDSTSAAGADAGGHSNKGGAAGSKTVNASAGNANVNGGAANSRGGNAASTTATASGNAAGIANSSVGSGGTSGTAQATTTTPGGVPGTSGGTPGATTAQGGVSGTVTSPIVGGTTAQGGVGQAGTQSAKGGNTPGGAATGGTTAQQGGAAGKGGTATSTGGVVTVTGGTTATGGVATGGVATGGVATGGVATGGVATGGTIVAGDTTPPTVVSISPEDGSAGITADASITLEFSEQMNKSSVTSAISVSGIFASDLNFQWDGSGTSVTITPNAGLQYAAGTNPTWATPKTYTVTLGATARDLSGNALSSAYAASFATLRRITQGISAEVTLAYNTMASGTGDCTDVLQVGGSSSGGNRYGFVVFDVSILGAVSAMYSIESAKIYASQVAATGNFYSGRAVHLAKIQYDVPLFYANIYPVTADVGTLSTSDTPADVNIDALAAFKDDFVAGNARQMYKLTPTATSWTATHYANFDCGRFHLDVTYLIK